MRQRTYPQLFVFNEKHGDRYIMVHSPEAEEKMFLKVLTERNQQGWYSWMKDYKPYGDAPKYSREDIDKMPESMEFEKKRFMQELTRWEKLEKEADNIRNDWSRIQKAIQKNDGKLAYRLIDTYRDSEYEGYERVYVENIV